MAQIRHVWTKSSRCEQSSCVEVMLAPEQDLVLVRDSKVADGPILRFSRSEWSDFISFIKDDMR